MASKKFSTEVGTGPFPAAPNAKYADIGYAFDERKYLERSEARLRAGGLPTAVPRGWPEALHGPLVWTGSDFPDESVFIYHLTAQDKEEIAAALRHFKTLGRQGKHVNRESFPLPNLQEKLLRIREDVLQGREFAILRGLDVDAFGEIDLVTVYLGLTSYVAELRGRQNHRGAMLIHVVNSSEAVQAENATVEMPFHTDLVCDVVATLTKSCGARGGAPVLASAWTVYNELAATRPDLIHVLAEPDWPFDTFSRNPPYYHRALLHHHNNRLLTNFSRRALVGHEAVSSPRSQGVPGLTEAQAEALDALHAVGRKHELSMAMCAGDVRFVNNLAVMHRRESFEDPDPQGGCLEGRRHLMRLWLGTGLEEREGGWELPGAFEVAWERVFGEGDERGERWDLVEVEEGSGRVWARGFWEGDDGDGIGEGRPLPGVLPPLRSHSPATACD